jgi:hypothetical protein
MTTVAFCHEGDPSSAFATFSPLRRGEGYSMMILARSMVINLARYVVTNLAICMVMNLAR